jgi:thiamine-phosphate diphosphorylase
VSAPVVHVITDRRRLAAVAAVEDIEGALVEQVRTAAHAGAHLVQIRERDLEGRALVELVARCVAAVAGTSTRLVVNERLDVAMAAGAHGVHLRATSFPAPRLRTMAPRGFVIGRSVHGIDELRTVAAEGGLDYLLVGPVYETTSKPGQSHTGLATLRLAVESTTVPVLALGGLTLARVGEVMQAGAAGVAAIGLFLCQPQQLAGVVADVRNAGRRAPRDA